MSSQAEEKQKKLLESTQELSSKLLDAAEVWYGSVVCYGMQL